MKTKKSKAVDTYMLLIKQHPLKPIRTAAEHDAAKKALRPLLTRDDKLDTDEQAYASVLAGLIGDYESKTWPSNAGTPLERLKFIVEEADMTQANLAKLLGVGQPAVNLILKGKRGLTTQSVKILAEHFRLSPAYFI